MAEETKRQLAERFGLMNGDALPGLEAVVDHWRDRTGLVIDPSANPQEYRAVPKMSRGFAYRLLGSHMEKKRLEDPVLAALRLIAWTQSQQDEAAMQMSIGPLEVMHTIP